MQPPQRLAQAGKWASKAASKLPSLLAARREGALPALRLHVRHGLPYASTLEAIDDPLA